jgi:thiol-disulfide isomerase/thioredoxin
VVQEFGGRVRFVVENYGNSEMARRFGVRRYPAIFAGDVLVATPKDFGFYGKGEGAGGGRYAPFNSAASHERFRADLARVIGLLLAGRHAEARAQAAPADTVAMSALPALALTDLDGKPIAAADLAGRVVLVEFWATWCPPCRSTLAWLADLAKRHGDRLVIVAIATESDEADVRKVAAGLTAPLRWTIGTPDVARAFGDISGLPTLLVFDRQGRGAAAFYGATPTLHAEVETKLAWLLGR